jgi:HAD superfamily hydrolase (TIGR01509 family)
MSSAMAANCHEIAAKSRKRRFFLAAKPFQAPRIGQILTQAAYRLARRSKENRFSLFGPAPWRWGKGIVMTPKAVYWDMDGTLVDSEPLHEAALIAALHSVGILPPADLHERVLGVAAWPVYQMMRAEFGLALPFDDWIMRKYHHYLPLAQTLKPRAGAIEIYLELQEMGVAQAVVSNSDRMVVEANLRTVGLHYPGMKTVSRNDVREGKPHPEPFLRAAFLTGVKPAESFVIEDSHTGARAGLAAGMNTIFWPQEPMEAPDGALAAKTAADVRALLGIG